MSSQISFDSIALKQETEVKFLGIYIDEGLTWKSHISYIFKKVTKFVGIFLSVIKNKNIFVLYLELTPFNLLYYSLVFYLCNQLKAHFSSSKTSCAGCDKF